MDREPEIYAEQMRLLRVSLKSASASIARLRTAMRMMDSDWSARYQAEGIAALEDIANGDEPRTG